MWVRRKGYSFVLKFIHRTFLFPYSAFLSSCLWSIPRLGPGPTELIQAWCVFEINGSSAGEKEKLRNGIFVILASAPCGICQNFLNRISGLESQAWGQVWMSFHISICIGGCLIM